MRSKYKNKNKSQDEFKEIHQDKKFQETQIENKNSRFLRPSRFSGNFTIKSAEKPKLLFSSRRIKDTDSLIKNDNNEKNITNINDNTKTPTNQNDENIGKYKTFFRARDKGKSNEKEKENNNKEKNSNNIINNINNNNAQTPMKTVEIKFKKNFRRENQNSPGKYNKMDNCITSSDNKNNTKNNNNFIITVNTNQNLKNKEKEEKNNNKASEFILKREEIRKKRKFTSHSKSTIGIVTTTHNFKKDSKDVNDNGNSGNKKNNKENGGEEKISNFNSNNINNNLDISNLNKDSSNSNCLNFSRKEKCSFYKRKYVLANKESNFNTAVRPPNINLYKEKFPGNEKINEKADNKNSTNTNNKNIDDNKNINNNPSNIGVNRKDKKYNVSELKSNNTNKEKEKEKEMENINQKNNIDRINFNGNNNNNNKEEKEKELNDKKENNDSIIYHYQGSKKPYYAKHHPSSLSSEILPSASASSPKTPSKPFSNNISISTSNIFQEKNNLNSKPQTKLTKIFKPLFHFSERSSSNATIEIGGNEQDYLNTFIPGTERRKGQLQSLQFLVKKANQMKEMQDSFNKYFSSFSSKALANLIDKQDFKSNTFSPSFQSKMQFTKGMKKNDYINTLTDNIDKESEYTDDNNYNNKYINNNFSSDNDIYQTKCIQCIDVKEINNSTKNNNIDNNNNNTKGDDENNNNDESEDNNENENILENNNNKNNLINIVINNNVNNEIIKTERKNNYNYNFKYKKNNNDSNRQKLNFSYEDFNSNLNTDNNKIGQNSQIINIEFLRKNNSKKIISKKDFYNNNKNNWDNDIIINKNSTTTNKSHRYLIQSNNNINNENNNKKIINNNSYNTILNIYKINNSNNINNDNPKPTNIKTYSNNNFISTNDYNNTNPPQYFNQYCQLKKDPLNYIYSDTFQNVNSKQKDNKLSKIVFHKRKIISGSNYKKSLTPSCPFPPEDNDNEESNINTDFETENLNYFDMIENNYENTNFNSNKKNQIEGSPVTNLEVVYVLESKVENIMKKINNYEKCSNECFDWINYYFSSNFFKKETRLFKLKQNKANITYYMKMEILCYFLCYDVSFNKNFNQAGILLKTILNLIHTNFLILEKFIIKKFIEKNGDIDNISNENIWIEKLNEVVDEELKNIKNNKNVSSEVMGINDNLAKDMNENNVLLMISHNLKEINNYYKMIIDNLYSEFYSFENEDPEEDNEINNECLKFPKCLKNKISEISESQKLQIISIFFFDAYRLLNTYDFDDLKSFFDLYLYKQNEQEILLINYNYNINNTYSNNNNSFTNKECKKNKNYTVSKKSKKVKFYLPPIKPKYKYTLVLDLDETLVYCEKSSDEFNNKEIENEEEEENDNIENNKNKKKKKSKKYFSYMIFRPGLLDFLRKMKQYYELVLFSFGTAEYVDQVTSVIEKDEKFFEYKLYRDHATFAGGEFVKDLSILGRDLKKVIIVDDIPQMFKMNKSNGICIKAFYGDAVEDKKTLKILGKILEKMRYDAEECGDIRISLQKQRNLIFTHITTNNTDI